MAATISVRRFAATYRRHVLMLGVFVFLIIITIAFFVQVAVRSVEDGGAGEVTEGLTPGSFAAVAFAVLLLRALIDVYRTVLRDRALWSVMVSPAREALVRDGLAIRTVVFQMGLLTAILTLVVFVLLTSPNAPAVPRELGPLVVLGGLAGGAVALPMVLLAAGGRTRRDRAALAILIALASAFFATLQLDSHWWVQGASGLALVAGSALATHLSDPVLAEAWARANKPRSARRRRVEGLPPMFRALSRGLSPANRALFEREFAIGYPASRRGSVIALNVLFCFSLIGFRRELEPLVADGTISVLYYDYLVTPFLVGFGIYAVVFFQVVMPLLDGFTREGPAIWVLKASPVDPTNLVASKARPLFAFLPLTVVTLGVAVPYVSGLGWLAITVSALGVVAVYLAFAGIGSWAGATYPNLDRHSNAPPDLVLAFNMMVGCLVLEGLLLAPVLALAVIGPLEGVTAGVVAVLVGALVYMFGVSGGGRAVAALEVS